MTQNHHLPIEVMTLTEDVENIPHYASSGASGADVRAHLKAPLTIDPCSRALIPTGLRFVIPQGYEIQVRPRSGLALKHLITVLNTPGTIDADYRGELQIILINHGKEAFTVTPGMRIAQLILAPVVHAKFILCDEEKITATLRGTGGFGHTGIN